MDTRFSYSKIALQNSMDDRVQDSKPHSQHLIYVVPILSQPEFTFSKSTMESS